ncbi:MAG: hypothetical protein AB8B77_04500 [Alphaproteobacteria bacterium]
MFSSFAKIWFARCLVFIMALNVLSLVDAVSAASEQQAVPIIADQRTQSNVAGIVTTIQGQVTATSEDGEFVRILKVNDPVYAKEMIQTDFNGGLKLKLIDDTVFTLSKQAIFYIDKMVYDPDDPGSNHAIFTALQGAFFFISGKISKIEAEDMTVNTPTGTIAIRGTAVAGNIYVDGADVMEASLISGAIDISDDRTGQTYVVENNFTTFQSAASGVQLEQQDAATMLSSNRTQFSMLNETELTIIESQLEDEAETGTQQIIETITDIQTLIDIGTEPDFPIGLEPPPIGLFEDDPNPPQNEGTETLKEIVTLDAASENAAGDESDDANPQLGAIAFTGVPGTGERDNRLVLNLTAPLAVGDTLLTNAALTDYDGDAVGLIAGDPVISSATNIVFGDYGLQNLNWGSWASTDPAQFQYQDGTLSALADYGHWVAGNAIAAADLPRFGKAALRADIKGDFFGSTIIKDAITGEMNFLLDLDQNALSGDAYFNYPNATNGDEAAFTIDMTNITLNGSAFSAGFGEVTRVSGGGLLDIGDDLEGGLLGQFYGTPTSDLLEIGGSWQWNYQNLAGIGVFAGSEISAQTQDYISYINISAGHYQLSSDDPLANGQSINEKANNPSLGISGNSAAGISNMTSNVEIDTDGDGALDDVSLSYVEWGDWSGDDGDLLLFVDWATEDYFFQQDGAGKIVALTDMNGIYTNFDDLPQSGSADFTGVVAGNFTDNTALTGTIGMNVDFASDVITGDMALERDNAAWISPDIAGTLGDLGEFTADLSSNLNAAISGTMDGTLLGTSQNPAEAMGAFNITDGTDSASGVFVAVKQ